VIKPFSPRELLEWVKEVLRRGSIRKELVSPKRVVYGTVIIDEEHHEVQVDKKFIFFTAIEFRLLHFLATRPGRVFTRNELISRILGENTAVVDRNINVHVRALRRKLGKHQDLIQTVRGIGYCLRPWQT